MTFTIFSAALWWSVRYLSVWFVIFRTGAFLRAFPLGVLGLQRVFDPSWRWEHPDADTADDLVRAVHYIIEKQREWLSKIVLALAAMPFAWGHAGSVFFYSVFVFLAWDVKWILLDQLRLKEGTHFNNGVLLTPPNFPRSSPQKWIVFEGGLAGAFYYQGIMQTIVLRFGKSQLSEIGFAGASSGGWSAGYTLAPIHSPYDVQHWAMEQMGLAPKLWRVLPLGMLFAMPLGIRHSALWGMRTAQKFGTVGNALLDGKYLMWMTRVSLQALGTTWSSWGRLDKKVQHLYRSVFVVKPNDPPGFGDACVATGLLPLMSPRLAWPMEHEPCLDGYLFLPGVAAPSLEDPSVTQGKRLVIGWYDRPCYDSEMGRINIRSWRNDFKPWRDFLFEFGLSTARHAERLFALGEADAAKHVEEIDSLFARLFNMQPKG